MHAEEAEEEDVIAQTIRNKLGSDWVVGDKSAPALSDDERDEEERATMLRTKLKNLKRSRETSEVNAMDKSAASLQFGLQDDKSASMWSLLSEGVSAAPQIRRFNSASRATDGLSTGPSWINRLGSFKASEHCNGAERVGQLNALSGGNTTYSKTFVFGMLESSSHTKEKDETSTHLKVRRVSSSGFPATCDDAAVTGRKTSLLATVLSNSKHWGTAH